MESKGASLQASRFALLHVDDESDNEDSMTGGQKKQQGKGNQQTGQAKKKNKKKRKEASEISEVWTHEFHNPLQHNIRTTSAVVVLL